MKSKIISILQKSIYVKRATIFFICFLWLTSCQENKEKILIGYWTITDVYYHEEPVIYDLHTTRFNFNKNHTCFLPTRFEERESVKSIGDWKTYKQAGNTMLQISTENELFNRTYNIISLEKKQDMKSYGYYYEMTLVADSLKMVCWRQYYGR